MFRTRTPKRNTPWPAPRETGHGYHGFEVHATPPLHWKRISPGDLTVNAMVLAEDDTLIDPYGGERTQPRWGVAQFCGGSPEGGAVARFAARYADLGFSVAEETLALMADIVTHSELEQFTTERIWTETHRALGKPGPTYFLKYQALRALHGLMPAAVTSGIDRLHGPPPIPAERTAAGGPAVRTATPAGQLQQLCTQPVPESG